MIRLYAEILYCLASLSGSHTPHCDHSDSDHSDHTVGSLFFGSPSSGLSRTTTSQGDNAMDGECRAQSLGTRELGELGTRRE